MNTKSDLIKDELELRHPRATDGFQLNQLVAASPPLDTNSVYCNLLQCQHFADTAVAAVVDGELVGFISGYTLPNDSETLFIWQVVVGAKFRGKGLAKRMMNWLIAQPSTEAVRHLTTTITPDNQASWKLFEGLARDWHALMAKDVFFERKRHFANQHDDEYLLRVSPLPNRPQQSLANSYSDLRSSSRLPLSSRWLD